MRYLYLSLDTPQENLALDEALLDYCEEGGSCEILRLWEPKSYFVVLGYSNKISAEVNLAYCGREGIPVLRRISGGGTVLQGPGCLNYALVLDMEKDRRLQGITRANQVIMDRTRAALEPLLGQELQVRGDTDLTLGFYKFSGNAQRRRRRYLLFHGTLLLDFDLEMIEKTLRMPLLQPEYRKNRRHLDFVKNLPPVSRERIGEALMKGWNASEPLADPPLARLPRLVADQYSREDFIRKF